jgi:hypothetical protein
LLESTLNSKYGVEVEVGGLSIKFQPPLICQALVVTPPGSMLGVPPELLVGADKTSDPIVVKGGGGPPLPCPEVGMVQVAMVTGVAHEEGAEGLDEITRISLAELPVSSVPINRLFDVFG